MRLCLFSSYSEKNTIDNYIKYYIKELSNHFDKIIFITNHRQIDIEDTKFLNENNIVLKLVENKGYDFGMYYHVIKDLDVKDIQILGLVNDSCILFKRLDNFFTWFNNQKIDLGGFTDSITYQKHIQSYFWVFKKRVIHFVKDYFLKHGIIENVADLILTYELGFCKHLLDNDFKIAALYNQKLFDNYDGNMSTEIVEKLLEKGIPLIKRKVIYKHFRADEVSYLQHKNIDFNKDYKTLLYLYGDKPILDYVLQSHRLKIYQIYYDVEQIKQLSPNTMPFYNSKLSVYFENDLLKDFYYNNKIDSDYFGILSWRFNSKNGFTFSPEMIDGDYDAYVFEGLIQSHDVFYDSVRCHPYFMDIFKKVLQHLKIDVTIKPMLGLYQNSIIAKQSVFKKYMEEYLLPTMDFLNNMDKKFPELNQKLWADAKYKYDPALTERLHQQTGKPYYTYHTFICERLWSVYCLVNDLKLKIVTTNNKTSLISLVQGKSAPLLYVETGSIVEEIKKPITIHSPTIIDKTKEHAICIFHTSDCHSLEKINQQNTIYDFYLTSFDNLDISKWHKSFKKHKIMSQNIIADVESRITKQSLANVYAASAVSQLIIEQENISKQKYKTIVMCSSLSGLGNLIDFHKLKMNTNTIYVKKGNQKYWFGKADVMSVFVNFFTEHKFFSDGAIEEIIVQFALRRNIKIIEC
jgi:hypothetical protein